MNEQKTEKLARQAQAVATCLIAATLTFWSVVGVVYLARIELAVRNVTKPIRDFQDSVPRPQVSGELAEWN